MQFDRLRLAGFKSFIDATELVIKPGLSGLVGSNGCGKSNLAEALRWVMGENSYKSMRASRGEDVIFAGSATRPAANFAEVTLYLDNSDFSAPPAFNSDAELQISRRISREGLSLYRLNGRELRAKDVQFLFADQASGADSPAQVGQGRVAALIEAKPQARRTLLEEAAGIGGLAVRRQEASLRLRATDNNLARVQEILAELASRLRVSTAQAETAARFKRLSAEIRGLEAALFDSRRREAEALAQQAETELNRLTQILAQKHEQRLRCSRQAEALEADVAALRQSAAAAGAARQRLALAVQAREETQRHSAQRRRELAEQLEHISRDSAREAELLAESRAVLQKLAQETSEAAKRGGQAESAAQHAAKADDAAAAAAEKDRAEAALRFAREQLAAVKAAQAEKDSLERFYADMLSGLQQKAQDLQPKLAACRQAETEQAAAAAAQQKLHEARRQSAKREQEEAAAAADYAAQLQRHSACEARAAASRAALLSVQMRRQASQQIMAQAAAAPLTETAADLGGAGGKTQAAYKTLLEQIEVEQGYEPALSAALGEALQAATDSKAGAAQCWRSLSGADFAAAPLPRGAAPISDFVRAPKIAQRALAAIGLIAPQDGAALQQKLQPGQILVSLEGALWRWDGFTRQAGAAAAGHGFALYWQHKRLEAAARQAEACASQNYEQIRAELRQAAQALADSAAALKTRQAAPAAARQNLAAAEAEAAKALPAAAESANRLQAAQENYAEARAALAENKRKYAERLAALPKFPPLAAQEKQLAERQAAYEALLAEFIRRQAEVTAQRQEAAHHAARAAEREQETQNWQKRQAQAEQSLAGLTARREAAAAEMRQLEDKTAAFEQSKTALFTQLDTAEKQQRQQADALAAAEAAHKEALLSVLQAEQALSGAREARSRADERLSAANMRKQQLEKEQAARFAAAGQRADSFAAADKASGAAAAGGGKAQDLEQRLSRCRQQRERLGAVNLQAEEECAALLAQYDTLNAECADIAAAQDRLRQAVTDLNREGRARLRSAFARVNSEFSRLFQRLFSGGTAELQWVDSDDPLNVGLEILVCPPGKKLQTISLLSGGEQCLTALSLIFAVFLTNPAPICVLDEVDAPLDDYNVERYCRLLQDMTELTKTRFLVVTHNVITMAHMDRLFGVTMMEKGVSTLVSVDLQQAAAWAETESRTGGAGGESAKGGANADSG